MIVLAMFVALLLFPALILLLLLVGLLNYWQSLRMQSKPKPKGTIEILPAEDTTKSKKPAEKNAIVIDVDKTDS